MERGIDLVIPMVFPGDPVWRQDYAACFSSDPSQHVRYRSWDTEELLVRCCLRFLPWLRRIHILLARESQLQPWMTDLMDSRSSAAGPRLEVHFHRDFIPEEHLPCFASPCIEMFLDRIPGLSEQFIYANDDMFPLSPLIPEDFFRDGLPCLCILEEPYSRRPGLFERKCMAQQNMVGEPFGKHYTTTWLRNGHSFAPILLESCREVWRRHGDVILRDLSPLRRTDRSYNHYVYLLYQFFSGRFVRHAPRRQLAGTDTPTDRLAAILRDPRAGIVCLNDNESFADWQRRADVVRREILHKITDSK